MLLTIIGAGPGGYVAAIRAAQKGASVTVIEESEVGGTCLNWGCIPTKTLIASVQMLEHARNAAAFGIEIPGEVTYSLTRIRERKDKVVATQVKGIRSLFTSWGVRLIAGRGSLIDTTVARAVQRDGTTQDIRSDRIIIATGSRPARLSGYPFDGEAVLTSDDAVQMKSIPGSIIIVGAGVIGCEFAFIYRALGASVTIVEMMPRALSAEDHEISGFIERELKKNKIRLLTNVKVEKIRKGPDGKLAVGLSNGTEMGAEKLLVSVGRSVNTENIGLENVGVETGRRGEILVNDKMETNVRGIYAIGDVTGTMMLAHVASRQGLIAAENSMGGDARMDYAAVPAGIFTMPEIGSVGLREQQAAEQGISVRIGRFPYRSLGKAHAMGEYTGLVKVIADAQTDKVIGVHICGAHATDFIHEGALAIRMGITSKQLAETIHAHPTLAEAVMEAAEDVHGMAIHVLKERE
jgi:dihydrolipoamide dehydrogenase